MCWCMRVVVCNIIRVCVCISVYVGVFFWSVLLCVIVCVTCVSVYGSVLLGVRVSFSNCGVFVCVLLFVFVFVLVCQCVLYLVTVC